MSIDQLIRSLAEETGLHELRLDENGQCRIEFDENFPVDFKWIAQENALYLYSVITKSPPTDKEVFYARLLESNLPGVTASDIYLSLDPDTEEVLMVSRITPSEVDFPQFKRRLEYFIDALENGAPALLAYALH